VAGVTTYASAPSGAGARRAGFTLNRTAPAAFALGALRVLGVLGGRRSQDAAFDEAFDQGGGPAASTSRPSTPTRTSSTEMSNAPVRLIQAMIRRTRRSATVTPLRAKTARATGWK
jgi:hypothetical protein